MDLEVEDYETQRLKRIQANQAVLRSLGLLGDDTEADAASSNAKKRGKSLEDTGGSEKMNLECSNNQRTTKRSRKTEGSDDKENARENGAIEEESAPLRTSARLTGKPRPCYAETSSKNALQLKPKHEQRRIHDDIVENHINLRAKKWDASVSGSVSGVKSDIDGIHQYSWITISHLVARGLINIGDIITYDGYGAEIGENGSLQSISTGIPYASPAAFISSLSRNPFKSSSSSSSLSLSSSSSSLLSSISASSASQTEKRDGWHLLRLARDPKKSLHDLRKIYFDQGEGDIPGDDYVSDLLLRTAFGTEITSLKQSRSVLDAADMKTPKKKIQQSESARRHSFSVTPAPINKEQQSYSSPQTHIRKDAERGPFILATGLDADQRSSLEKTISLLGGVLVPRPCVRVSHVVTAADDQNLTTRTYKYVFGVVRKLSVVRFEWVTASSKAKKWLDFTEFRIHGDTSLPHETPIYKFQSGIFKNRLFHLQGTFTAISKEELEYLIYAGGGRILPATGSRSTVTSAAAAFARASSASRGSNQHDSDTDEDKDGVVVPIIIRELDTIPMPPGVRSVSWIFNSISMGSVITTSD